MLDGYNPYLCIVFGSESIDVLLMDRQVIITAARKNVKRIGPRMLFHTDGTTNSLDNIFHCEFNLKMSV